MRSANCWTIGDRSSTTSPSPVCEELALVVDDTDEGLVRPAVRLLPERLHGRAAEQSCRPRVPRARAGRRRSGPRAASPLAEDVPGARRRRRRSRTAGRRGRARERRGSRRPRAAASSSPPTCRSPAPAASPRPSARTRGRSAPASTISTQTVIRRQRGSRAAQPRSCALTLSQSAQAEREDDVRDALAQADDADVDDEQDHLLVEVAGHPEGQPELDQADDRAGSTRARSRASWRRRRSRRRCP